MATLRTALRKITFPSTPDTFVNITTVMDYLVYTLPYSTNILLYNDIDNPLVTRTFRPKEIFLASEILVTDTSSPNYNYPVIQEYVTKGIFSKLPLSTTSSIGEPGVPADPTVFNVETIHTILPNAFGSSYIINQGSTFKRDNLLIWVARYSSDGIVELPRVYMFDLIINNLDFYNVTYDASNTWYYRATNPVLDSQGIPWVFYETPNVGTPANYDYHLTTFDDLTGTLDMSQAGGTVVLSNRVGQLDYSTLLIDALDNKYLCASNGIYKVVGNVLTLLFAPEVGLTFRQAEYKISTNTFLIKTGDSEIIEVDLSGTLLQSSNSFGSIPVDFATGGTVAQVIISSNDGPYIFEAVPYLTNINPIQVFNNSNNTIEGFIDGDQNTGEISLFDAMVLKYDISDTDIYFIDVLDNIGV